MMKDEYPVAYPFSVVIQSIYLVPHTIKLIQPSADLDQFF